MCYDLYGNWDFIPLRFIKMLQDTKHLTQRANILYIQLYLLMQVKSRYMTLLVPNFDRIYAANSNNIVITVNNNNNNKRIFLQDNPSVFTVINGVLLTINKY